MTEHDDKISAEPNFAKLGAHGLDDIERGQAPADMGLVPLSNLRRRDADHAHSEPLRLPDLSTNSRSITIEGGNQGEPSLLRTLHETTGKRACA